MITVHYLGAPVDEFLDLQEALDGYRREIQLAAIGGGAPTVPQAVADGIVDLREALDEARNVLYDQARTARDAGLAVADMVGHYPEGSRDTLLAVMDASEAANVAAQDGTLLGLPLSDTVRHVQAWLYRELRRQLEGGPAHPYAPLP